jgi:hypothetical protein
VAIRYCRFDSHEPPADGRAIWARRGVSTQQCPKSIITSESLRFIEEFQIWKRFGCPDIWSMPARTVEAISILEDHWQKEIEFIKKSEGGWNGN